MLKRKWDAASSTTQGCDSSFSSFPYSEWDYEVFLSFRGPDTRKTFTDHLYNALVNRGIRTFRDDEELRVGEEIDQALRLAIHKSKIAIPIFSQGYAWSKWCLRELAEIVECMKQKGQRQIIVMPVFYHVHPSHVRHQIGCYEEAFRKHEKNCGQETEGWKKAMNEVADLKGWDLEKIADGHEGELIKIIVEEVWIELKKSPLIVSDTLVGINSHIEEMMKLLRIESKDKRIMVGIHGLGGIGKTTIARCVYNAVYRDFDVCSFIADARENFQMKGLVHLVSQLLRDILNLKDLKNTSLDDGIQMIRQRLSNKKVLIVFDDVDFDLKAIIGNLNWFGSGSRIIITTRDRHILDVLGAETYEPNEMNSVESLELFSKHAFKRNDPPENYLGISKEVVETTGGLPLALEVIGSYLFGTKELSLWKDMAKKLKKIQNHEVQKKLRVSYDGLDREEKVIFLDIACFFVGMDKRAVCYILDDLSPKIGIDILCRKSLVKIDENNELRMHDQLRDLGREIVYQENPKHPGERSRLWSAKEVIDVLHSQKGTKEVEGLSIKFSWRDPQRLVSEGFTAMTNLRLLQLDHAVVSEDFMNSFSELRWFSWKGCRSIHFTPTNPTKLVVLDLSHGDITESCRVWSSIKVAKNLKVLDLRHSYKLFQNPNLSAFIKLEELILHGCVNLATIDDSIGHLKRLVVLNMKGCVNLKNLPTSIFELSSLQRLDISLTKISQLPEKLGHLEALMELLIDNTPIERLPNSIGDLRNLKTFSADNCNIQEGGIPNDIGRLSSLEILILSRNQCHSLPAMDSNISLLRKLSVDCCMKLQLLPELSNLTNLEVLQFDLCQNLRELPVPMNGLTKLQRLSLYGCSALQYISHLPPGLMWLTVNNCTNVREISAFRGMRNLETLQLSDCPRLTKIESLEGLYSLQLFKISSCHSLRKLPNLRGLKKLRNLTFDQVGIAKMEGLKGLYSLKILNLESCRSLSKIQLPKNLREVRWCNCNKLCVTEGFEGFESLEKLDLKECSSLRKIQLPKKLRILCMESNSEIEGLEDLESLEQITIRDSPSILLDVSNWKNLKHLHLIRCNCMEGLPDLSNLNKLNNLCIVGCGKLIEVPSVDRLESLEDLVVCNCESLKILPDLSNLTKLRTLRIRGCVKLTDIQGVERLEILEHLCIDGCISIETLPCMSRLKKLKYLSVDDCVKLTQIQGVDKLESLEYLHINNCISVETLPSLSGLRKLKVLSAVNCSKLTEIQGVDDLKSCKLIRDSSSTEKLSWAARKRLLVCYKDHPVS